MSRILTELHGREVGLDAERRLIVPRGLVMGDHGSQIISPCPLHTAMFEDFLGDVVPDQIGSTAGSDGAAAAAAVLAGAVGGAARLTTGAGAGASMAANGVVMVSAAQWKANAGRLVFQARVKMAAISTICAFVGFTDTTALEMPINSAASADTLTTNATDAVGFMFDTAMATDNWWLTGVANDVDATAQNTGYAPVADTYETFRIELDTSGGAVFYRNGVQIGTSMSGAVTASVALTPVVAVFRRAASSTTMDVDYWHAASLRV